MFKKVSSGILMLVLIVLLGVYFIVRFAGNKERTFKDKILSFDPAKVTQILISNPGKEAVDLHQTGGKWMVASNGKDFAADSTQISGMLKTLSNLPTKRYAGRGKDVWSKYELTDSAATLVTLKSSGKNIADLYVGKFTYTQPKGQQQQQQSRQQQGDMTTFVRIPKDDDVYAVDGFLKMNFNRDAAAYRNRYLSLVTATDITRITDEQPEGRFTIDRQDGKWALNGTPADSVKVVRYRSALARIAGSKFIDDPVLPSSSAYTLTIEGNNFSPITLKAYPVADTNINFIVTSSYNPGAFFNGKEGGLFKKIWQGIEF